MRAFSAAAVVCLIIGAAVSSCTTTSARWETPAPIEIAQGQIHILEEYERARDEAERLAGERFGTVAGKDRVIAAAEALMKLPSVPSRLYAMHIRDVLRAHGIRLYESASAAAQPAITYEELAQSYALTQWLLGSASAHESPATQRSVPWTAVVPLDLQQDLMRVVVAYAPGDDAATTTVLDILFNGDQPSDVARPLWKTESQEIKQAREFLPKCASRYATSGRKLNLTSLWFFGAFTGTPFHMFIGAYSNTIKGTVDWEHIAPEARQLCVALLDSAKQALVIDRSPKAQLVLNAFIDDANYMRDQIDHAQ